MIPVYYLFTITPVTEYVLGADIHEWTTYRAGSDQIFEQKVNKLSIILVCLWLFGFLCIFLRKAVESKKLLTQMHILSTENDDAEITCIKDRIIKELKIRKNIKIFRSNLISSPCICGICQPKIYMPKEEFTTLETELLLRHELYHFKRQDVIYNMFIVLFGGIYWFHPMMHFFTSRLFCFCEMTCDKYVLKNATDETRIIYAQLLIRISKKAANEKKHGITSFVSYKEKFMKMRLYNIMKNNFRKNKIFLLGGIITIFVLCPSITYASTLGVTQTYNKLLIYVNPNFKAETSKFDDELEKQKYDEYLDNGMGESIHMKPMGVTSIDCKIVANGFKKSTLFMPTNGGELKVFITGENTTDQFQVVIKSGLEEKIVNSSINGDINYTYNLTSTLNYKVTVENLSSSEILHVVGCFIVRD